MKRLNASLPMTFVLAVVAGTSLALAQPPAVDGGDQQIQLDRQYELVPKYLDLQAEGILGTSGLRENGKSFQVFRVAVGSTDAKRIVVESGNGWVPVIVIKNSKGETGRTVDNPNNSRVLDTYISGRDITGRYESLQIIVTPKSPRAQDDFEPYKFKLRVYAIPTA